jgi:triosephosphate isomerase
VSKTEEPGYNARMRNLILGNWKLYVHSLDEGRKLLRAIDRSFPRGVKADVVVCPPVALAVALRAGYRGKRIAFGTQDVSTESEGAHTGEVSAVNLAESGIEYVIVGHAERRAQGDTDTIVAKKAAVALAANLHPIVCVGESVRDKDGGHFTFLKKNITESLARVEPARASALTIAYDPLWAIGQNEAPTPAVIREAVIFIRKTLADMWGRERALKTRIIYGGSVDSASAGIIAESAGVQGVLPGRASVQAEEFCAIIKAFSR